MFLKEFREHIGLSQKEFAKELGVTQVSIARYETGKMNPTTLVIKKYIDVFNANPNFLFLGCKPHFLDDIPKLKTSSIHIFNEIGYEIDTKLAVKNLTEELNLKNDAELAEKLNITRSSLSMLKRRNSLGTLIEKVLICIDKKVCLNNLVYGYNSNCFKAQTIAIENEKDIVLEHIINDFIDSQIIMKSIKTNIKTINARVFFEKIFTLADQNRERFKSLLYLFSLHMENTKFDFNSKDLNKKFYKALKEFDLKKTDIPVHKVQLKEEDLLSLINWAKNELDYISIIDILMTLPIIIKDLPKKDNYVFKRI